MDPAARHLSPPPPASEVPEAVYSGWISLTSLAPLGLLVGRLSQILIQVATFRVLTTLLSSQEVGRFYLLIAIQTGFSLFLLGAPVSYLSRKFLEWKQQGTHALPLLGFTLFVLILSLLCIPVVWLATRCGWISSPAPAITYLGVAVWLFVVTIATQLSALLNLLERRLASVMILVGTSLFGLMAAYAAVKLAPPVAEAWLGGYIVAYAGVGAVGLLLFLRAAGLDNQKAAGSVRHSAADHWAELKLAWEVIWPIALILGLYWGQSQGYRFALSFATTERQVGLFVIAYSMGATIILVGESVLHQWVLPAFYNRIANTGPAHSDEVWKEYVAHLILLMIPLAPFAIFAGPFLLKLLAGPDFQEAAPYAIWGGLAESVRMLAALIFVGGVARLKTRELLLPNLPGAIIAVGGAYLMGRLWNLHGVGLSLALSYAAVGILSYLFVSPNLLSQVRWRNPSALLGGLAVSATLLAAWALGWRESFVLSAVALGIASLWLAGATVMQMPALLRLLEKR